MRLQIIQDGQGKNAGVFIPMEDWTLIKNNYPDVDSLDEELPDWQKSMLDKRIADIAKNPTSIRPIQELFDELDSDL